MRRTRDVDGLVGLLSDRDPLVRVKALDVIAKVGDSRAIRPLIKALGDEDPYVREHAARNLGCDYYTSLGCDTGESLQPLLELLDDPDIFVRVEAARSLGDRGFPAAREPLEELLREDQRWEVRQAAAQALGFIGSAQSIPVLRLALEAEEEGVVRVARESLGRIIAATRASTESGRHPSFEMDVKVGGGAAASRADVRQDAALDGGHLDGGRSAIFH